MTPRANPLTPRATAAPAAMIPSRALRTFVDAVVRLGFQREDVIRAARVEASVLLDADAAVPSKAIGELICFVEQRHVPNLGLRIACETPLGAFPLLDYLVLSTENVGEAMHVLAGYVPISGSPAMMMIDDSSDPIRVLIDGAPFTVEYSAALTVQHLRGETNGRFAPEFLSFTHDVEVPAEFRERLGCEVRSNAAWNGLAVSSATWKLPLRRRDPVLRDLLRKQADEVRDASPARKDIVEDVQRAIRLRIGSDTSIRRIASDLTVTARTLQRRLGDAGSSYEAVRDAVMRQTAERCLAADQLSIGEIAYLLGYSEPAAFHRAFKRWTKSTPQSYRAAHQRR